jgi:hypothetical protein
VSEAIHAANNLKAELKFTELETNFENTQSKQLDEEQTLHIETTIINQPNDKIKQAMWNKFTRFSDRNF